MPTSTGAARATTRAVPELAGRFDRIAVRAPIPAGSVADIVCVASRPTTTAEVNEAFRQEGASARYDGILGALENPLVSADTLVKVMAWYDNEWGLTQPMIREARSILGVSSTS